MTRSRFSSCWKETISKLVGEVPNRTENMEKPTKCTPIHFIKTSLWLIRKFRGDKGEKHRKRERERWGERKEKQRGRERHIWECPIDALLQNGKIPDGGFWRGQKFVLRTVLGPSGAAAAGPSSTQVGAAWPSLASLRSARLGPTWLGLPLGWLGSGLA